VHVWRADLRAVDGELGELLCEQELARAERLLSDSARVRWTRCHGILRSLLARYLGGDPRALQFSLGEHGKPALQSAAASPLQFNLSHSADVALYAVSESMQVGIDVEVNRRPLDELALAARVLGEAEAERLGALDPETRTREFLRSWVAHEAAVKCRGTGLGRRSESSAPAAMWTTELEIGPGAAAAVVAEQEPSEVCLWEWSGSAGPQPR
jgi:4'-phosphopantetheinyl transferase